jgi:acyl carrier protein
MSTPPTAAGRRARLVDDLKQLFERASGLEFRDASPDASLVELGVDSLLVTQLALRLKQTYKLPITFRQLMEELPTIGALADHLDRHLPAEAAPAPVPAAWSSSWCSCRWRSCR